MSGQRSLFEFTEAGPAPAPPPTVPGLRVISDLLSREQEAALLQALDREPWLDDLQRRVQHYGYKYDYKARRIDRSMRIGPLPPWAEPVLQALEREGALPHGRPDQMIVNEYQPGQGISAHVDCVPCFRDPIITVSLGSKYEMEFCPEGIRPADAGSRLVRLPLAPRSALVLSGDARYRHTHAIRPRKKDAWGPRSRRVSLTFRWVILN